MRAFIRQQVPSRTDADDILQEVAVVLWEKFDEFRAGTSFTAWACGIARYKILAWLRDKGRDRMVLDADVVELIADDSLRAESHLEQQREALEKCFRKISAADRDLLTQAYRRDTTIRDVAAASGRSPNGFYQWLHRMRLLLLECISHELAEESVS